VIYSFFVPGKPQPKQRPRKGRYGNFYTPPETKQYERYVRNVFWRLYPGTQVDAGHCWQMHITICGKCRADGDNILKVALDALQGLVYKNDRHVSGSFTFKPDAEQQGVYVELTMGELISTK
jgi:crossover junction endodeoxyribonuclease RusA